MGKKLANLFLMVISLVVVVVVGAAMPYAHAHAHGTFEEPSEWLHKINLAKEKVTKLHFYFHETGSGKNQTSMTVAQSTISSKPPGYFGVIHILDNLLTLGPEPTSKRLGRVQGLFGLASLEEIGLLMAMNFAFTDGKYKGSTLALLGRNLARRPLREMPIVGGTGVFRLARGIATAKTVWFNINSSNAVLEYHVWVIHY